MPLHVIGDHRHRPSTPAPTAARSGRTPEPLTQPPGDAPASTQPSALPHSVTATSPQPPAHAGGRLPAVHHPRSHGAGWGRTAGSRVGPRHDLVLRVAHPPGGHVAHAAGDPGDTISDYQFAPATITVHVGDAITWTNNGPSPHTATASDGSFDTGTLNKGASASHTFTQPGTFAYICSIHPFMHGTVVVLAAATSSTPATSGSGASSVASGNSVTTTGQTATTTSGPTLPITGLDLTAVLFAGAALIGAGVGLRRRGRRTS